MRNAKERRAMDSLDPTTDETKIKIACVQMQPVIGRVEANVAHSIGLIDRAAEARYRAA